MLNYKRNFYSLIITGTAFLVSSFTLLYLFSQKDLSAPEYLTTGCFGLVIFLSGIFLIRSAWKTRTRQIYLLDRILRKKNFKKVKSVFSRPVKELLSYPESLYMDPGGSILHIKLSSKEELCFILKESDRLEIVSYLKKSAPEADYDVTPEIEPHIYSSTREVREAAA